MEELKEKCRKLKEVCFEGEVTMTKVTLWMIAAICLLAGIIRGLRMAPMTHGVMIGCGNGNGSGSGNANGSDCEAGTGKLEQGKEKGGCRCRRARSKRKEKRQK